MQPTRSARSSRRWSRWWLVAVFLVILIPLGIYSAGEIYCRRDFRPRFDRLHGTLVSSRETPVAIRDGQQVLEVVLTNDLGLQVRGKLQVPMEPGRKAPALLILGGVRTGRNSIDYITNTRGVALLALDYPYEGKKSGLGVVEFVASLPAMRRAVIRTIPAAALGVDYLLGRDDIDPDRITLAAGSVGALFAPAVAATEGRIAALVLLFGGGDLQSLLEVTLRDDFGLLAGPVSRLGAALTCPVEPLEYIAEVSPRPVFMLNGTEDLGFPERNVLLLFETAREPKTLRWIEAGHVVVGDEEFKDQVTSELASWLVDTDLIPGDSLLPPD